MDVIKRSNRRTLKIKRVRQSSQPPSSQGSKGAEKSCKQVAFCIFRRMRNTSNQLFPKRSDERVSLSQRRNESKRNASEEKDGSTKCALKVRSSHLPFNVAAATLLTTLPLSSFSVTFRISSRAFRPEVISYLYAGAKNSSGKSDEASSFRFRVTNHLSRGARFRSTPKRGERWNCNDSKNSSRCGDQGIMLHRLNICLLTLFNMEATKIVNIQ